MVLLARYRVGQAFDPIWSYWPDTGGDNPLVPYGPIGQIQGGTSLWSHMVLLARYRGGQAFGPIWSYWPDTGWDKPLRHTLTAASSGRSPEPMWEMVLGCG